MPQLGFFSLNSTACLRSLLGCATYLSNLTWSKVNPDIPSQINFYNLLSYPSGSGKHLGTLGSSHSFTIFSALANPVTETFKMHVIRSFLTTSLALTHIQDIFHLDNCNGPLKWFSKFCSCTLLSLLNTLGRPFKI